MLPEWDFGGDDAKRREFIAWMWAELDRLAVLTTLNAPNVEELPEDWQVYAMKHLQREKPPHREETSDEQKAWNGMNLLIREYALARWIINRHWPLKRRPAVDPAHAANIVIDRCARLHVNRKVLLGSRRDAYDEYGRDLARRLIKEWDACADTPGRRTAAADIAMLDALPAYMFAS